MCSHSHSHCPCKLPDGPSTANLRIGHDIMNVWQLGLLLPNILLCAEQMETDSEGTVTLSSRGARAECSCEERPANTSLVLAAQKMAEEVSNDNYC